MLNLILCRGYSVIRRMATDVYRDGGGDPNTGTARFSVIIQDSIESHERTA